jgi:Domain of unknown function (DUF1772)
MALALIALVVATLFAGAAVYISIVEHPARLTLDNSSMLAEWQLSYKRALPIQAGVAVVGGIAGLISWYQSEAWQWLAGSVVLLTNWPFTLIGIMPTNKRLMAVRPTDATKESRTLLNRWGSLHSIRSLLGSLAAALFAWVPSSDSSLSTHCGRFPRLSPKPACLAIRKGIVALVDSEVVKFNEIKYLLVAERVGFEPTVRLPVRRISSAVLSTTQPPLRGF